jgi:hypothetical protein
MARGFKLLEEMNCHKEVNHSAPELELETNTSRESEI